MERTGILASIGAQNVVPDLDSAIALAEEAADRAPSAG
jgi:hypothetical protein